MINRRIIRGKVLQQLFAYKTCEAANYDLVQELIIQHFSPILNHNFVGFDPKKLEGFSKLTLVSLEEHIRSFGDAIPVEENVPEVKEALLRFLKKYQELNAADKKIIVKKMIEETERIFEYYLMVILLIKEVSEKLELHKKTNKLLCNTLLKTIVSHPNTIDELQKHKISWANDQDVVNALMAQIYETPDFKNYSNSSEIGFEEEKKILLWITKQLILKNASVNDYFEALDLHWDEDKVAVKDMLDDTIKSVDEMGNLKLASLSKNWPDDKAFMKELFEKTLENESVYEKYLQPQLTNWDISRLTGTDGILLKMCIAEMIHFANIPVKVSINEYIELSKKFSTPKSKTLINGVLDNLSQKLIKEKVIRKSGRGLLDSK